ncbi:bifunctional pyr operon transcriptional regulator/uracil phosphoribosyltransferase PyrR, partial [Micromonospora musae]
MACPPAAESPPARQPSVKVILASADVQRVVDRIAHQILEKTQGAAETVLLGIPTRGAPLARRLA